MVKPLAVLILAHLLADFILQPASLIALKQSNNKPRKFWNNGVFWHSLVHWRSVQRCWCYGACGPKARCLP
jgi:hypothetical protein